MNCIRSLAVTLLLVAISSPAMAADGLIAVKSPYAANETVDRLESVLKEKGLGQALAGFAQAAVAK